MPALARAGTLLCAAFAGAAAAAEPALPLLELMARNVREANYRGIFTY